MSDPFEALHEPITPMEPDPTFAARLRDEIRRALLEPEPTGGPMTTTETTGTLAAPEEEAAAAALAPEDLPLRSVTPYLAVHDGREALDWYVRALGARRRGEPIVMDDDRLGHAELAFGDSVVMLSDEFPEIGVVTPRALSRGDTGEPGVAQTLRLQLSDVDTVVRRAVEQGATLARPVQDSPYGRNGVIIDPYGHRWLIAAPPTAPATAPAASAAGTGVPSGGAPETAAGGDAGTAAATVPLRHGDVGYTSLWLPDVERAADFYGAVLGWATAPGGSPQGRQVQNLSRPLGLWGGQEHRTAFPCFAVDDVAATVRQIRDAGGTAEEPRREPYGLIAECVDDQGMAFAVYEPEPGDEFPVGRRFGRGEVVFLTFEVPDSVRFRAFFRAVFGWEFVPGRVHDGWEARLGGEDVRPMAGLQGGHETFTVVPMYAVDDIDAAVARVRAAGGTATAPERQPFGFMAECTDDQGSRFHLGQL